MYNDMRYLYQEKLQYSPHMQPESHYMVHHALAMILMGE